jgi:hemerythrin-like domain-containing protein
MKITSEMKIKDVLKIGEHLADSFALFAPEFARLKNPETVDGMSGQVTIRQAARIAQVPLSEVLYVLNLAAGAKTEEIADELNSLEAQDFEYPEFSVERNENLKFVPDFTKPLDLLIHWHSRMTTKLETLIRAGEKLKNAKADEVPFIIFDIKIARNYLLTANAKHKQDEELSLFPRLRERRNEFGAAITDALDDLEAEHRLAEKIERALIDAADVLTGEDPFETEDVEIFHDAAKRVLDFYRPHLKLENESIYPAARRILSDNDLLEIGKEMRVRRMAELTDEG